MIIVTSQRLTIIIVVMILFKSLSGNRFRCRLSLLEVTSPLWTWDIPLKGRRLWVSPSTQRQWITYNYYTVSSGQVGGRRWVESGEDLLTPHHHRQSTQLRLLTNCHYSVWETQSTQCQFRNKTTVRYIPEKIWN